MTDQTRPLTEQQLDEIEARATRLHEYASLGVEHADAQPAAEKLIGTDVPALLAEVRRLQADLTQYEVLNPQQCPAGKHADWLVDSEYAHACPWCQIEALKGAAFALAGHAPAGEQPAAEGAQR